jgi:VWFA-related protein
MERRTAFFLALTLFVALPADAAKRVTVAGLAQTLTEIHNKPDAEVAWQIGNLELTERLTSSSLARLQSSLPGEKSKQALLALADEGAYLDLPAAELPAQAAPNGTEQRRMMGLVVSYVRDSIPRLPNFFATRETTRFEDSPQLQKSDGYVPYEPLHFRDRAESTVLYRDGREVVEGQAKSKSAAQTMREGLSTWGVFGPILSSVLLDAARSKLAWGHWEQGATALEAVFTFAVPKEKSHYEVNYCCIAEPSATVVAAVHPFQQMVGYHGEMAIDPNTGAILRLTVVADLKTGAPIVKAAIVVDYGSVELGGKSYMCPVRSVSTTVAQTLQLDPKYAFALALQMQPLKTSVNDVAFEQYHMFRSDARVLTAAEAELVRASDAPVAAGATPPLPALGSGNAAGPAEMAASPEQNQPAQPQPIAAAAAESVPAAPPPEPEFDVAAAPVPTDAVERTGPAAANGFTLRTTTRLVDVALIAYDKKGHPVTDLKPEDLEVYDNGRKQEIRFFNQAATEAHPGTTAPSAGTAARSEPASFSNRPAETDLAPAPATANTTVFLIDASNVAFGDLTYARSEMLRFLKTLQPEERVALYIMKSYGFQILLEPTADHATVATTLSHWMPSAQDLARAQDEETRNRQHIDWVAHSSDLAYVNGNDGSDPEGSASGGARTQLAAHGVDPKLRSMGSSPGADALLRLEAIAHHLASLAGHKSLVWVSSDNALADWSNQAAVREEKGIKDLDPLAMRARESLNEAHVSIYPLDVSQLEAGVISADLENRLVQVKVPSLSDPNPPPPPNPTGRYAAAMHQDTRPIQPTFRELAEATGGRALRRAGDIAAELNSIVADGRAAYLISFSPDMPADDTYHQITVKLAAKHDLRLHYRTGYLYAKDPASLKDRFKQAIWEPRDAGEVGLTATPETTEKGPALRLEIRGTDLALAQQGARWSDRLDIFLALRNDTTFNAQVTGKSLQLRLMPGTYQKALQDGVPFEDHLPANAQFDSARIVVIDRNSGRVGTVTIPASAFTQPHSSSH